MGEVPRSRIFIDTPETTLETGHVSSAEDDQKQADLKQSMRAVRAASREKAPDARPKLPPYESEARPGAPLSKLENPSSREADSAPSSPGREELNELWDVSTAYRDPPPGLMGRLLGPIRGPLRRLLRFALGPVIERQVQVNSAQVRFDNEMVQYVDERLDRVSRHYDDILGQHGKRMEEIDARHLILQQELVRHVHDLVERIEFVFETAEINHLHVEAVLRETREELTALIEKRDALSRPGQD